MTGKKPTERFQTLCLIASDAFLTSDERQKAYEINAFGLAALESTGIQDRFSSEVVTLRCRFPPRIDDQVGNFPMLGTARPVHSTFRSAETTSLSVRIEGEHMNSPSLSWTRLAMEPGTAKMHSSHLKRLLVRGHSSATEIARTLSKWHSYEVVADLDDSEDLDLNLLSALDAIMRPSPAIAEDAAPSVAKDQADEGSSNEEELKHDVGINGVHRSGDPRRVGMHSRVLVVLTVSLEIEPEVEDGAVDLSDLHFESTIVSPEGRGVTGQTDPEGGGADNSLMVLAVSLSGTVHNIDLARTLARRAQSELQLSSELAASQVLLLRAMAKLCKHVEDEMESIEKSAPGSLTLRRRTETAYRFISIESFAKRVLEGSWCLNEPGYVNDRLLSLIDSRLGLTAYWRSECERLTDICRLGGTLLDGRMMRDVRISATERSSKTLLSKRPSILLVDRWSRQHSNTELESHDDHSRRPLIGRLVNGYVNLMALEREVKNRRPRLVEFHPFSRSHLVAQSISGRLTTATMMTATSGLLLGLLVGDGSLFSTTNQEFATGRPPPVDIFLLFVSTFSFFFETLILAYASRCLSFSTVGIAKLTERASDVSLYLGQYSFVVALPLAVSRLVGRSGLEGDTLFLSIAICGMAMVFLCVYFQVLQAGSFSLLSNPQVRKKDYLQYCVFSPTQRFVLLTILHSLSALLFLGTVLELADVGPSLDWLMWPTVVLLIGLLFALVMLAWRLAAIVELRYFEVDEWDLMGAEMPSSEDES